MIVVGGSASRLLSAELARERECELAGVETRRFPDGECYVRILDDITGEDVILVQTSFPDWNIIELLLLQDAILEFEPSNLTTVVPYFGYGRQDKKFEGGEAVSARAMARHIGQYSDNVLTIDIHNPTVLPEFGVPARNLSAMPAIGRFLAENGVDAILSPDEGSKERARTAAESAGCGWDFLKKTRIDGRTVEMRPKALSVDGKTVAIVDDIIATGGTVVKAAEQLREQGASKVIAACTHGLFTEDADKRLKAACDMVVSTDTIESSTSKISAADTVASAIL